MYRFLYYDPEFSFDFESIVDGKKLEILCNSMTLDIINSAVNPQEYGIYGTIYT